MATAGPGGPWVGYQDREGRPCWYNPATGEWTYDLTATGYAPKAPQAPQAPQTAQAAQALYMGGTTPAMMMGTYGQTMPVVPGMQMPQMGMPAQQPMMAMTMPNPQGGAMYLQSAFPGQVMQAPQAQPQMMPPQHGHMMQQQPAPGQQAGVNGWVGSHPFMTGGALLAGGAMLGAAMPYAGQFFTGQGSPTPPQPFPVAPGTPQGQQAWLFPAGIPGVVPGTMPTPMKQGKHDGGSFMGGPGGGFMGGPGGGYMGGPGGGYMGGPGGGYMGGPGGGYMGGPGGARPHGNKHKGGGKEKKKENGLAGGDAPPSSQAAVAAAAAAAVAAAAAAAAAAEPETGPGASDPSQQGGQPRSPEEPGVWERIYPGDGGTIWRHSGSGVEVPFNPYA